MSREVFWKSKKELQWICDKHCIRIIMNEYMNNCLYSSCTSVKPKTKEEIEREEIKAVKLSKTQNKDKYCSWSSCTEKRRENSIYCSVSCKNKNARHRYRMKKKGLLKEK